MEGRCLLQREGGWVRKVLTAIFITQCLSFLVKLAMEHPVFSNKDRYFLSTEEAFDDGMKKSIQYIKVSKNLDLHDKTYLKKWVNIVSTETTVFYLYISAIDIELPTVLHELMFLPTVVVTWGVSNCTYLSLSLFPETSHCWTKSKMATTSFQLWYHWNICTNWAGSW